MTGNRAVNRGANKSEAEVGYTGCVSIDAAKIERDDMLFQTNNIPVL